MSDLKTERGPMKVLKFGSQAAQTLVACVLRTFIGPGQDFADVTKTNARIGVLRYLKVFMKVDDSKIPDPRQMTEQEQVRALQQLEDMLAASNIFEVLPLLLALEYDLGDNSLCLTRLMDYTTIKIGLRDVINKLSVKSELSDSDVLFALRSSRLFDRDIIGRILADLPPADTDEA